MPQTFLTHDEQKFMDLTVELVKQFEKIVGKSITRVPDKREFYTEIHHIQSRVLAQAAGRAYPDKYRLLGES